MNTFGNLFKVTLYGESHQLAIGIVVDGMPAGILIDENLLRADVDLRRPKTKESTPRKEADIFRITSGVFNGFSTGSPIHITIPNENTQSKDYHHLIDHPRPNHADFVSHIKYQGFEDYRGGGRFSGRMTLPLVLAGSLAKQMLPYEIQSKIISVGKLDNLEQLDAYFKEIQEQKESVGGVIEIKISKVDVGLGEPFFNKLDARLAYMLFSIPSVKAVSIGDGIEGASLFGSEFNDVIIDENGTTLTNHSGGIVGGISNGNDILIKVYIKPISSIQKPQSSFHFKHHKMEMLNIEGRHDVSIMRRVGIVLENACAIVLADMYLQKKARQ